MVEVRTSTPRSRRLGEGLPRLEGQQDGVAAGWKSQWTECLVGQGWAEPRLTAKTSLACLVHMATLIQDITPSDHLTSLSSSPQVNS